MQKNSASALRASIVLGASIAAGVVAFACSAQTPTTSPSNAPASATGIAVVELFTSEGCSSCPPADAALADLVNESAGKPVFALAFHVDYWNRLGWSDRFSEEAYSDRQNDYARVLGADNVYTPQVIVNGQTQFLGSHREALKSAVAAALADRAAGTLNATVRSSPEGYTIAIEASGIPAGTVINAAIVENGLSTDVERGENGGRHLAHERVVRSLRAASLDEQRHADVVLPLGAMTDAARSSIVVFAQRAEDMHILAATELAIPH